jgi:tripartite-type tricarboxylate transporter receptor subunit TctC
MKRGPVGRLVAVLVAALCASGVVRAQAQDYPAKDIHVILGFAAGSGSDVLARFFTDKLGPKAGRTAIVENKPGAIGNIAAEAVARAKPDGYTLLISGGNGTMAANRYLFKKLPYDPEKDFTPVTTIAKLAFIMMVSPKTPVNSVQELTAYLKKKGQSAYGTSNTTSLASAELYKTVTGVNSIQVNYKATADGFNDLLGGQIDFMFMDAVFSLEQARAGKVKALAVTSAERASWAPDIPAMSESGVPGFDLSPWWGYWAPAGTPQPIIDKLARWINEIVVMEETKKFLNTNGAVPFPNTPKGMAEYQARETVKWGEVLKAAKVEPQ